MGTAFNPFEVVFYLFYEQLSHSGLTPLIKLTSGLAFASVLWQVLQIMMHSDSDKLIEQKKSNIKKILIAFAIIISIQAICQMIFFSGFRKL